MTIIIDGRRKRVDREILRLVYDLYKSIREKKIYDGIRVDDVKVMEGRGIVSGWDIRIRAVRGRFQYLVYSSRNEASLVHIIPEKDSVVIAVSSSPGRNECVITYR